MQVLQDGVEVGRVEFDKWNSDSEIPWAALESVAAKGACDAALKALAVLATDTDRQEQVWRAAQKLIVTGERQDSVAVAEVGFRLSERGFAPNLPWASMAYSADREMRQLAAAMLPFLSEIDYEAAESLSRDAVTNVRCELAILASPRF